MREVSVVMSWMDPKLIVDLFFGLSQLGWAMPAPTMQLREAPPEYPIEALKADCGNHNSKLISRCRPSGDDKLENAAWEKTEEELSSEMILGPFFDLQDVPFPFVRLLRRCVVLGNSTEVPRIQLCGWSTMLWREARMVRLGPNLLIVRPIWTRGPLNAAWSKNISHSLRCLNS